MNLDLLGFDIKRDILITIICDYLYNLKFKTVKKLVLNNQLLHVMFYYFTNTTRGTLKYKYKIVERYLYIWQGLSKSFKRKSTYPTRYSLHFINSDLIVYASIEPLKIQFKLDGPFERYTVVSGQYKGSRHYVPLGTTVFKYSPEKKTVCIKSSDNEILSMIQLERQLKEYYSQDSEIFLVEHTDPVDKYSFFIPTVYVRPSS